VPEYQNIRISEELRAYCKRMNYTQSFLAEKLGVTQTAVSKMLSGRPFGKNQAQKWGSLFGIRPNWLITGEGEMFISETPMNPVDEINNISKETPQNIETRFDLEAIEALNKVIKKISVRYDSVCQDNERLRDDNSNIRRENDVFRIENDRLRSKIKELKKTIDALKGAGEGAAHA